MLLTNKTSSIIMATQVMPTQASLKLEHEVGLSSQQQNGQGSNGELNTLDHAQSVDNLSGGGSIADDEVFMFGVLITHIIMYNV